METLTLDKALELYELIGEYIPDIDKEADMIEFIGKIIGDIKSSGNYKNYTDSVILMSGKTWKEIKELKSEEVLELFVEGLSINKIVSLKIFCNQIGFGNA